MRKIPSPRPAGLHALSSDGNTLAAIELLHPGSRRRVIRVYEGDVAPVLNLDPGDNQVSVLAFSPDSTRLLSGFERGSAILWDVQREGGPAKQK